MKKSLFRLFRNRRGQSLVEYGILIGAVAIVGLAATSMLGHKISSLLGTSAALLPGSHVDDQGPLFVGHLVNTTTNGNGAITLSSIPGTFQQNLGITGASGLVTDE